ncbi:AbrB/MazE/SpoVT family DNA-binding domain-containing protein [Candidatus Collinsella stercoripullorum]|uniref:AbrB/MazE/SpoVT family DNA-binding domain-containing protein n=1 Tax=Candidatus Collinsella stercoripullorum TaxID=2838522 RepID=UPI0022E3DB1A|nr:AbrB/MazE/SpoVT family DNA-binding domain-containing protein [Candidatus Collinsella stercoripullorum]
MVTMMSTKLTKGGQTTVPKEVRTALGIADGARVYWSFDGRRAWVSAAPTDPLEVTGEEDFRIRLAEAKDDAAAGRVRDARAVSAELRARYNLA